ncbi:MAG: hypothetical protein IT369_15485 [Candidatus Latescibacteria bacterium]|nr:hypothetical protein [Candidatus Latescibacterota bacterium]
MQDSIKRVSALISGGQPDRAPLFDLLRNDAVLEYFSGQRLTPENTRETVYRAYAPAIDATRPLVRLPASAGTTLLPDGRRQVQQRWTVWTEHRVYPDAAAYTAAKRRELDGADPAAWTPSRQQALEQAMGRIAEERRQLGEVFFVPGLAGPGLMGIYGEIGLEAFSYCLADEPEVVVELLERNTLHAISLAEHYPADHGIALGFLGDDIAFKSGPLLSPAWMRQHYFPRLARVIAAWHGQGIKVLFHSDGNLHPILDDLVDAGIDGLNPIEVLAGMDIVAIHRRHPQLFMAGGIDVSQLLPFGSPQEVRDAVKKAIDDAGGRIMVGSSTELNDEVPLANFLALREAVLDYRY